MSVVSLERPPWSRHRWIYSVGALFLLQIGLVIQFGRRPEPLPERPIFRTAIQLAVEENAMRQVAVQAEREDPLLLALPTLRGFSGPAWLEFSQPSYQPEEVQEPPHWLTLPPSSLGAVFSAFVATNTVSPLLVADKPIPRLPRYEPNFSHDSLPLKSRLQIEGELARRPLLSSAELPSWPHPEVLSNSVVQVAVDLDGVANFAALLTQSGSKEADAYALAWVGRMRFQLLPREPLRRSDNAPLTWGRCIFRWHTLPVGSNDTVLP